MQRIMSARENEQERAQHPAPLFKRVRARIYELSPFVKLKDLGISSFKLPLKFNGNRSMIHHEISMLNNSVKQLTDTMRNQAISEGLERINHKHKVELSFSYPVMNPTETNQAHLSEAYASINKRKAKLQRTLTNQAAMLNKAKSEKSKLDINTTTQKLIKDARLQISFFKNEASKREQMLALLKQLTVPTTLKTFMEEVNKLNIQDKRKFELLLTAKEQLLQHRQAIAAPYELMFAYNAARNDFMVGIRSHYDHDHPHPTIIGGEEPEVMVAGTIDLRLDGEVLKIGKIRIDSGHYKPESDSFELIIRYILQDMNPTYFDEIQIGIIEGDITTPTIAVRK
jgi:hypothetical protein